MNRLPLTMRPIGPLWPSSVGAALSRNGCLFRLIAMARENSFHETGNPEGVRRMMPESPYGRMGSVVHRVLQWGFGGGAGVGGAPPRDGLDLWDRLIEENEREIMTDPLSRHYIPLRSEPGYEIRRLRVSSMADLAIGEHHGGGGGQEPPDRLFGTEVPIQDEEGAPRIRGRIDLVEHDGDGFSIIDWKTGGVIDEEGRLIEDAVVQVQLYGALHRAKQMRFGQSYGFRAARLINPVNGRVHDIPSSMIGEDECERTLRRAVTLKRRLDREIADDGTTSGLMDRLAHPTREGCRHCRIRPACGRHIEELGAWMRETDWNDEDGWRPKDVVGDYMFSEQRGPGSCIMAVTIRDGSGTRWRVSGVDAGSERNRRAFEGLKPGDRIGIFNVRRNRGCRMEGTHHMIADDKAHIVYRIGNSDE